MKDGVVQQVDSPMNLYERPANLFVAGFIGSPAMNFLETKLARQDGRLLVDGGVFRADVPPEHNAALADWVGKPIIFGIRPEDVYDRASAPSANGALLRANVDVHEPLGSDVILYLTAGAHTLVARVDAHSQARMGQATEVVFNMKKMHVFNPETHAAIL
jgi:multiple sugar transport system ATP-binding protein